MKAVEEAADVMAEEVVASVDSAEQNENAETNAEK